MGWRNRKVFSYSPLCIGFHVFITDQHALTIFLQNNIISCHRLTLHIVYTGPLCKPANKQLNQLKGKWC